MPVVASTQFTRPDDVVDYWLDSIEPIKETLGFNGVYGYEHKLIPASTYPALAINPGRSEKTIHGTRTWLYTWRVQFYILHAKATGSHLQRSREEAALTTRVVDFIEADKELAGLVVFSFITDEVPGVLQPFANQNDMILSTRLDWFATSEGRF